MSWIGDFALGSTFDIKFTARRFTTGAPFTLAGSPAIAAYVDNSTTELTAGITLTVDFDARTGLNNVRVVATSGNGYAAGANYQLVITAGTVDSVSVVGEVIAQFSLEARAALRPTVAGRTLDVSAAGEAGIDWANIGSPTTAQNLSATNIDVDQVVASVSGAVGSIATGGVVAASFAAGAINAAAIAADAITDAKVAADVTIASVTGSVGSVAGAVGSVTGAVGSVTAAVTVGTINASVITATSIAADAITAAKIADGAIDAATFAAGAINAAAIAADAITDAKVAADVTIASVTGSVGSVTGAVGSVTGAVGSIATGGITAASFGAGAIDAAAIAADAIGSSELAASAITEIQAGLSTLDAAGVRSAVGLASANLDTQLTTIDDFLDTEIASIVSNTNAIKIVTDRVDLLVEAGPGSPTYYRFNAPALELAPTGGTAPSAATIADAVWDEARAGHVAGGSFGEGVASVQGNVTGSVASVSGAVGSVTGNVGGNVVGSVGSVATGGIVAGSFAAGAIDAAAIAADAIGSSELAASAATEIAAAVRVDLTTELGRIDATISSRASQASVDTVDDFLDTEVAAIKAKTDNLPTDPADASDIAAAFSSLNTKVDTIDDFLDTEVATIKAVTDKLDGMTEVAPGSPTYNRWTAPALEQAPSGSGSSPAVIADAVWDELLSGHAISGSAGEALSAAGTAGDPWTTALPGAYGAGTAGNIIGNNVNATISSRATAAALATVQTDTDDIQTRLPAALVSGRMDASVGAMAANVMTAAAAAADLTTELQTGLSTLDAAGVRSAVGLATANLDTQIAAVQADTDNIQTRIPAALVSGRMDANIGAMAANTLTASALATDAVNEISDQVWDEAIAGHLTAGSTGNSLDNATAAGNPWAAVIEAPYTAEDLLRLLAAVAAGKTDIVDQGSGNALVTFRDVTDASNMVVAQMANSERASVTITP